MQSEGGPGGDYARRVYDGTRRFTQDLLAENERLRARAAELAGITQRLEDELRATKDELERTRGEHERAARSLAEVEAENRDYSARYVEVETHNCNLMNLHVAMLRLHSTLERHEVLAIAQDVVIGFLGSEEVAVFVLDPPGDQLRLVASTGVDAQAWERVAVGRGLVGRAALSGRAFMGAPEERALAARGEETLTACVPLTRVGQVVGVLAVFRLLPHKPALEAFDHELLELLGTQVGMALHASSVAAGAPCRS